MSWLNAVYVFIIGACLGSFMNVLTYRLPRGLSTVTPPSSCTTCGRRIRAYDNIPIISWFILRGRCRFCGEKISFMYPLTEAVTGFLFLAVYLQFGLTAAGYSGAALVFFSLSAAFCDLFTALDTENFECGIIPDSVIVFGTVVCSLLSGYSSGDWRQPVYGAAAGFLGLFVPSYLYRLIRKKEGMGGGDIKLTMMCGAALGAGSVFFIIFGSALMLVIFGLPYQIINKKKDAMLPFGPFISAAAIIYLFYGHKINTFLF